MLQKCGNFRFYNFWLNSWMFVYAYGKHTNREGKESGRDVGKEPGRAKQKSRIQGVRLLDFIFDSDAASRST